ncbi:MAG: DsrE family protein [Bacteroidales bacterium]|nr:DsrE family protein [Bacteroidales bacterium]
MKKVLLLLVAVLFLISCNQNAPKNKETGMKVQAMAKTQSAKDGVFIHITEAYNDPHRVLMPLKMAVLMSNDKDVLVYMDIHAVELAVKGAKDLKYADFDSFQTYIKMLAEKGVGVYACPTCLKIAGYKPSDLMDGIQVAQKDKFFNFTKGRIITLDY